MLYFKRCLVWIKKTIQNGQIAVSIDHMHFLNSNNVITCKNSNWKKRKEKWSFIIYVSRESCVFLIAKFHAQLDICVAIQRLSVLLIIYIIWILIFRYPNIKKLTFNLTFNLKPALNLTRGTLNMQCHLYLTLWKWNREREGKKLKKRIYWSSSSFSPRLRLWFSSLLISGVTCIRKINISHSHKWKMRKTACQI
jgi:hypothetical protein